MEKSTTIRELLIIVTTISTILGFYTKTVNNFFINMVKVEYENIPGKQSIINMLLKYIWHVGIFIYIVVMIRMLKIMLITKIQEKQPSIEVFKNNMFITIIAITIFVILWLILYAIIKYIVKNTIINFRILKRIFNKRMDGEICELPKDIEKGNKRSSFILGGIVVLFAIMILGGMTSCFELTSDALKINLLKSSNNKQLILLLTISVIELIFSTVLIISINLQRVIEELKGYNIYILLTEKEYIQCRCYLEYNEYYLVKQNNTERYISKSKIKEIKKIIT